MPIVRLLADGMAGDRVRRLDAILNGTSNAVLSRMEASGCGVDEAIAEACAAGYAEADPSVDLDGADAAAKLAVLCALAFGLRVLPAQIDAHPTSTIVPEDFRDARERGGTIRQIAHAECDRDRLVLTAWVAPRFVPGSSVFARTTGPGNAAVIHGQYGGDVTLTGVGAGADALAVAAISDLTAIARDRAAIVPAPVVTDPGALCGLGDQKITSIRGAV